jgi:hypothetical protein
MLAAASGAPAHRYRPPGDPQLLGCLHLLPLAQELGDRCATEDEHEHAGKQISHDDHENTPRQAPKNGLGLPVTAYSFNASIFVAQPIVQSRTPSRVANPWCEKFRMTPPSG